MPADVDVKLPSLKSSTGEGRELSLEFIDCRATLAQTTLPSLTDEVSHLSLQKLLDQAKSMATIPTGLNPLYHVACVGVDEVWVSGEDKTVRRFDVHGSVRDTVTTTCKDWPVDITVTRPYTIPQNKFKKSQAFSKSLLFKQIQRPEIQMSSELKQNTYFVRHH
jgi:hypothetical protein